METQLKELIERINTEGVQSAEKKAQEIIRSAERKAEEILAQARREAEEMLARAKSEAAAFEASAREALKQAGRDLILKIRQQIEELFHSVVSQEVRGALTPKTVEESVVSLIKAWGERGDAAGLEVLLPAEQGEKLKKALLSRLAEEVRQGVQFELLPGIGAGFRLAEKQGAAYYDFTQDGISEFLFQYLNPRLSALLQEALGKAKS